MKGKGILAVFPLASKNNKSKSGCWNLQLVLIVQPRSLCAGNLDDQLVVDWLNCDRIRTNDKTR